MSKAVINIGYFCANLHSVVNAHLNGFSAQLLAESYGDQIERFPEGGIAFTCEDHSHRAIYVTISTEAPVSLESDEQVDRHARWLADEYYRRRIPLNDNEPTGFDDCGPMLQWSYRNRARLFLGVPEVRWEEALENSRRRSP
ncbi:hypothetical protein CCAX7_55040 [Capsulimonas corticalis]|uniref:Uncharacterized protein n=1 Tax=Capsulimonas corticalis TaxID=2219043 RepID=A0A402D5Q2_9BACT|nr:hypothetical protein [Capsulimonas corticalis]BDI33453.1 hypothetical protein CCAX7_55040 [Capsulimonas corticalis]